MTKKEALSIIRTILMFTKGVELPSNYEILKCYESSLKDFKEVEE